MSIEDLLEKLKTDQLQPLEVLQAYQAKAEALALEWMRGTFATFRLLLRRAGWDRAPALRPGPHRVRW